MHISKVTLHQIVDLYLQLCHNDGTNAPEPLYLTLSTRLTIPAEISDLIAAANEGKGLTEIHPWDHYDEGGPATEIQKEGQEPYHEEPPQHDLANEVNHRELNEEFSDVVEPAFHTQDSNVHDAGPELNDEKDASDVRNEGVVSAADNVDGEDHEDHENIECGRHNYNQLDRGSEDHDHFPPEEGAYDSEEQRTESTATLANLPASHFVDEHYPEGSTEDTAHDGPVGQDHVDEIEDPGEGYPEGDETNEDIPEHGNYPEDFENDDVDVIYDEAEQDAATRQGDPSPEYHEKEHIEETESSISPEVAADEDNAAEALQPDGDDALHVKIELNPDSASQGGLRGTPEPAGDLFGIGDDLFKSPVKGSEHLNTVHAEDGVDNQSDHFEDGEIREEIPHASPAGNQSEHGEILDEVDNTSQAEAPEGNSPGLPFDEDDYIDLGITESLDVDDAKPSITESPHRPDNTSTKRSREPEDEFELAEIPSPDLKRSRSS